MGLFATFATAGHAYIGCGLLGGANIAKILKEVPESIVDGLDYSVESVAYSKKTNAAYLGKRCTIQHGQPVSEPCILITRNEGLGQIPKRTKVFLKQYGAFVRGVVINGDKRFGSFYCASGPKSKAATVCL